jgi:NAD(P)-dependent dehydrogenase (short-subunit alcohol dehydrogenase family)
MGKLDGKVALVTGGGSGIGEATCEVFAREGAKVAVVDWNEKRARSVADRLSHYTATTAIAANVAVASDAERMVHETVAGLGGLDILYNNAGIGSPQLLHLMSEADWDKTLNVDLKGVFLGCKYAVPVMMERGGGAILSTASIFGVEGSPQWAHYCAAKAGVIAMTKVIAMDYAPYKIRANCICPGVIDTRGSRGAFARLTPEDAERARSAGASMAMLGRSGQPDEIAKTALFLCSDDASFITGQAIIVDGGYTVGHRMLTN